MTTNHSETLRAAADKLRALATAATHEDRTTWAPGHTKGSLSAVVLDDPERPSVLIETWAPRLESVNDYIAAMDPATGLALADWLDRAAANAAVLTWPNDFVEPALAIACRILGSDQ